MPTTSYACKPSIQAQSLRASIQNKSMHTSSIANTQTNKSKERQQVTAIKELLCQQLQDLDLARSYQAITQPWLNQIQPAAMCSCLRRRTNVKAACTEHKHYTMPTTSSAYIEIWVPSVADDSMHTGSSMHTRRTAKQPNYQK
jgi:hypothetical protein